MSTSIATVSAASASESTSAEPEEPGSSPSRRADDSRSSSSTSSASANDEPPPAEPERPTTHIDLMGDALLRAHVDDPLAWRSAFGVLLSHVDRAVARVGIRFVDDAQMCALHERFSGVPGTTDVLTFDASADDADGVEVDIAVCVDVAAREAAQRSHRVGDELLLYALHGVLHCVGYDDHTDADFAAMHGEEDRILAAAGLSVRFSCEGGTDGSEDAS